MTKSLGMSLGGMGTLVAGLLIILKKGPLGGMIILLVMCLLLLLVTVVSTLVNWNKDKKKEDAK